MRVVKMKRFATLVISLSFVTLAFFAALLAQSITSSAKSKHFHIQGTIDSFWDALTLNDTLVRRSELQFPDEKVMKDISVENGVAYVRVPLTEITFKGAKTNKTVTVDKRGFYQTDLPLGTYRMTALVPTIRSQSLTRLVRVFRVDAPATIILNGNLHSTAATCDVVFGRRQTVPEGSSSSEPAPEPSPDELAEDTKDACGGEDVFLFPAKDGTPFEVYLQYSSRERREAVTIYAGFDGSSPTPVSVAYNLFSLEAKEVVYDKKNGAIDATGRVVTTDESGTVRRGASMRFRFEDGKAILIR